jgi:hypothetical protein
MNAVLVSMSCFNLLCEEADIRCGSDDKTVYLLPNYTSTRNLPLLPLFSQPVKSSLILSFVSSRFLRLCAS